MWRRGRRTRSRQNTTRSQRRVSISASQSAITRRRARRALLRLGVGFVLAVLVVVGAGWVSFLNTLAVQDIDVRGNKDVRALAIEAFLYKETAPARLGMFSQQNLLAYPADTLEQALAYRFPIIETITIDVRPTQRRVVVILTERDTWARWCRTKGDAQQCYHVDETGFIFEPAPKDTSRTEQQPLTLSGGLRSSQANPLRQRIAPKRLANIQVLVRELNALELNPTSIEFRTDDVVLTFEPHWQLLIAPEDDMGATAFNLAAILDEHGLRDALDRIEYIDMRFGERVYYK